MRILIIMEGFFPGKKYGGPPVSVDNFCSLMSNHECYILATDHDMNETKRYEGISEGWNSRNNCKVMYVPDDRYNKATFEKTCIEIQPDILYLQGLFQSCVVPCLQLARKHSLPVVLAPRGELCAGAFRMKRWKKAPYVRLLKTLGYVKNIHWQSTSDEETEAIKNLMNVSSDRVHRLDNIPSIPKKDYLRGEKEHGSGRFVFLSRVHPKKNLLFALSLFRNVEGNVTFDIYGPIEDEHYWKQCLEEVSKLPKNVHVEYKGLVEHDQVHEVFSKYDAFLFPTLSENYGHVIAESLIVGTPVIISDQTPWTDINEKCGGFAISLDNKAEFMASIETICEENRENSEKRQNQCLDYIARKLNLKRISNEYNSMLELSRMR